MVLEAFNFSKIAASPNISAAAALHPCYARLLDLASALEAVVKATNNPFAARQLKSVAWKICQFGGGGLCNLPLDCQGECSRLEIENPTNHNHHSGKKSERKRPTAVQS